MRKYKSVYPKLMYDHFVTCRDTDAPPSFLKFALEAGLTEEELESFRSVKNFDKAYRACREIRRDYLIDNALKRRGDPSFTKFLLTSEFGMGEDKSVDDALSVTVTVEGEEDIRKSVSHFRSRRGVSLPPAPGDDAAPYPDASRGTAPDGAGADAGKNTGGITGGGITGDQSGQPDAADSETAGGTQDEA